MKQGVTKPAFADATTHPAQTSAPLPSLFSTTWQLALRVAVSLALAILLTSLAMRWISPKLQEALIGNFVVSPTPFADGVLLETLLHGAEESTWANVIAQFESNTKDAVKVRLLPIAELQYQQSLPDVQIEALKAGNTLFREANINSPDSTLRAYRRFGDTGLAIETVLDTSRYWSANERDSIARIRLVSNALFILVVIAIWLLPFWWNTRKLSHMAQNLSQGNLDVKVNISRFASLYPIAKALNTLAARVKSLIDSHKSLVNSAAHELRTPLTRLKYAQRLAHEANNSGELQHYLREAEREVAALDSLIDELLFYAKLDRKHDNPLNFTTLPAQQWLVERVTSARGLAAAIAPDTVIQYHLEATTIIGDSAGLTRIASNLLANALRYADSTVRISVAETPTSFTISVDDDGDGIPDQDLQRVFEPFVRLDESRQKSSESNYGLGLSIVARIAELHGGSAAAMKSDLGGARIVITWPRQNKRL